MSSFAKQCLHYIDGKAGALKPRSLGEVVHSIEVGNVIHFNFPHIETAGGVGENGVGDEVSKYLLVLLEDVSGYMWLESAAAYPATVAAETLLHWYAAMAVFKFGQLAPLGISKMGPCSWW